MALAFVWLATGSSLSSQAKELVRAAEAASEATLKGPAVIVEEYWTSELKARYSLLSGAYKQRLRRLGITNADEYERAIRDPERVWGKRTYQVVRGVAPGATQKSLLVEWEQEGYQRVMTFVFDLVLENDRWKIENIVH